MAISRKSHKKTVRRSYKKILKGGEPTEIHILYSLANYSDSRNHIEMLAMSPSLQNLLLIAKDIVEKIDYPMWEHGKKLNKKDTKFKTVLQNNMVIDTIIIDTENPTHKWQTVNLDSLENTQLPILPEIVLYYRYDQSYQNQVSNPAECKIPSKLDQIDMYVREKTGDEIFCFNTKSANNTNDLKIVVGRTAPKIIKGVIKSLYTYNKDYKSSDFDGNMKTENSEGDTVETATSKLYLYNPIPMKLEITDDGQLSLNLADNLMPDIISFLVKHNLFVDDDDNGTDLSKSTVLNQIVRSGYNAQYLIDYVSTVFRFDCETGKYRLDYNQGIHIVYSDIKGNTQTFETYFMMRFLRFFYEKYPLEELIKTVPLFRLINIPYYLGTGKGYGPTTIKFLKEYFLEKNINITPDQLLKNGLTIPQIRGTYTLAELTKSIPLNILLTNGITYFALEKAGIKTIPLHKIGLTVLQLKDANFPLKDLISAGYSIKDLLEAKFSYLNLLYDGGLSIDDLLKAGISINDLISGGVKIDTLLKSGVSLDDLISADVPLKTLLESGVPLDKILEIHAPSKSEYDDAGIKPIELKKLGLTALQLHTIGYSIKDLISAGYSIQDLRTAGISIADLKTNGITVQELFSAGFPLDTIFKTGLYTYSDIKEIYKANVNKYPDLDKVIQLCSKNLLRQTNLECKYNPSNGGVIETTKVYSK
jgi:hypothetical protein